MFRFRRFRATESGNVSVMTALLSLPLILIAGGGVDLMMHERQRVRLQDALDSGLIAASALLQPNAAEPTVRSYLDAAGFKDYRLTVSETKTVSSRAVTGSVALDIKTSFLGVARIPTMSVKAAGAAEEAFKDIEISFVLDLSGSMRGARINAMRPAAKNFIAQLLTPKTKDYTSINLIPFAGQVNVGHAAYNAFAGASARKHDKSSCFSVLEPTYTESIPDFPTQDQVPQFSTWVVGTNTGFDPWNCPTEETSISYVSNDAAALQAKIDEYHMFDGTATHIAMKWGLHLLDPGFRSILLKAKLAGVSLAPAQFANRPAAYSDKTLKVIVLMTDGEVVGQFRPKSGEYVNEQPVTKSPDSNKQILSASTNLSNMSAACAAAKAHGVVVYTIGFEVNGSDPNFLSKLKACASSPDKFYEAKTSDISRIFQDVARSISPLRLTN
ncbi:TadE/TadG family type IV pilus assembly protein [Chenggangzhangella methanolivorans]|uniref:TadE/TadG family protein n=1 Tax=Chenggangzhangella methanolivorans TaxID=1437009 RepID=A0A9E6UKJ6_9HYPH|nr:TadE/TadG family type IV pilus assembly protein [Chenggangzhangella methanolivorans]QZN99401.1 TadE/TadG family protein [Chenggangzhangella methanolivorans]